MKNNVFVICFLLLSLAFKSCNNDDGINQNLNGEYVGTFTVTFLNGESYTNPVTVFFTGENNYDSSGNSDYIPAGGSGTYDIGNSTIIFSDINIWTANFDPNLILAGEYEYSLIEKALTISAKRNGFGTYTYNLVKE